MGEAIISRRGGSGDYGTALAKHVLTPYTVGTEDGIIPGTMPDRQGDTAALAISRSGTTLKLRASEGYRDGVDDNVIYNEPNWIAENIPQGISIFGLVGINTNKKCASGTGTAYPNSTSSRRMLGITGLSFKPRIVIIWGASYQVSVAAPNDLNDMSNDSMINKFYYYRGVDGGHHMTYQAVEDVSDITPFIGSGDANNYRSPNGFYLTAASANLYNGTVIGNADYLWFACE